MCRWVFTYLWPQCLVSGASVLAVLVLYAKARCGSWIPIKIVSMSRWQHILVTFHVHVPLSPLDRLQQVLGSALFFHARPFGCQRLMEGPTPSEQQCATGVDTAVG